MLAGPAWDRQFIQMMRRFNKTIFHNNTPLYTSPPPYTKTTQQTEPLKEISSIFDPKFAATRW